MPSKKCSKKTKHMQKDDDMAALLQRLQEKGGTKRLSQALDKDDAETEVRRRSVPSRGAKRPARYRSRYSSPSDNEQCPNRYGRRPRCDRSDSNKDEGTLADGGGDDSGVTMDSVVASNTSFALSLYKNIRESHKEENVFFSPWSLSSALAMIYLGAKGNTAAQMAQVLHFNDSTGSKVKGCVKKARKATETDNDAIHRGFQDLISAISKLQSPYLLKTANRIFGETTYNFLSNYAWSVEEFYNAKQQNFNFIEAAEDARKDINSWVESQTESKIRDLLPPGSIDARTRLVLVNAVYFKANWEKKFPEENSQEAPFKLSKTETKPVQMMFQRRKFQTSYIEELMTKVLELPYAGNDLSMIILLPDDINDASNGLEELEAELSSENLTKWTSADMMETLEVEVELPRFKLEEKYNLKSILSNMGMSDAFLSGKADLTGMSPKSDFFLSQVFHQAFVEVNEEGTEAGAATAGIMAVRSRIHVVKFHADHPFLFFIRHNKTSSILFYGRFCSP